MSDIEWLPHTTLQKKSRPTFRLQSMVVIWDTTNIQNWNSSTLPIFKIGIHQHYNIQSWDSPTLPIFKVGIYQHYQYSKLGFTTLPIFKVGIYQHYQYSKLGFTNTTNIQIWDLPTCWKIPTLNIISVGKSQLWILVVLVNPNFEYW